MDSCPGLLIVAAHPDQYEAVLESCAVLSHSAVQQVSPDQGGPAPSPPALSAAARIPAPCLGVCTCQMILATVEEQEGHGVALPGENQIG